VTLCDSGPLYSLLDARQQDHARCGAIASSLLPLITTWPCFTEAMYFLGPSGGWRLQQLLWAYRADELLQLHNIGDRDERRIEA
jgi:hypothetical protein